ncbi:MAG: tetratricopeptide repeat protein [Bacteroidota bacterium]
MKSTYLLLYLLTLFACTQTETTQTQKVTDSPYQQSFQALTLLGDSLFSAPEPAEGTLAKYDSAKAEYELQPNDPMALIWYGRRAGYLGKYKQAIEIFTEGIEKHPEDARMYRHRGHRYLSTRQYDKAIADFEKAVQLIQGTDDQIEPDGLPNAKGIPISSLHGNIWYHLALAHYLKLDFEAASKAYQARYETHQNDDNIVSATHWYYMTLRRRGQDKEAQALLGPITPELDIIENFVYHNSCQFYKGLLSEEELVDPNSEEYPGDVNLYALGNWYLYEKEDLPAAKGYWERLLKEGNKASFAYLAAEAELASLKE